MVLGLALAACPSRRVETYQKDGVRFSYLSGWSVKKDAPLQKNNKVREIVFDGPNHSVLMLLCFPESSNVSLESMAAGVSKRRSASVAKKMTFGPLEVGKETGSTSRPVTGKISGQDLVGIEETFNLETPGRSNPFQVHFFLLHTAGLKVVIMTQVAVRHLERVQPGWQKIFDTLSFAPHPVRQTPSTPFPTPSSGPVDGPL
jgi:hypothetical protein